MLPDQNQPRTKATGNRKPPVPAMVKKELHSEADEDRLEIESIEILQRD